MPARSDDLNERLSRYRQINLTVTGRKSGRKIRVPVWFVYEDATLYLLPVQGSDTHWYRNILETAAIRIEARAAASDLTAIPVTGSSEVKTIIEKFRAQYGAGDVKKYYSKFDVAVRAKVA